MSRLTRRLRGEKRPPKIDSHMGRRGFGPFGRPVAEGYVIDGAVYELDGQPPPAKSKGWGDLGWMRRPW